MLAQKEKEINLSNKWGIVEAIVDLNSMRSSSKNESYRNKHYRL